MRMRVSNEMVEAGVTAFRKFAEDQAMRHREPMPDFDDMPEEAKWLHREAIRAVLQAGAAVVTKEASGD